MDSGQGTRGCGKRQTDGLYICSGLSEFGKPLENFLIIPPLNCRKIGLKWSRNFQVTKDKGGVWHLIDWVGENNYPCVWDFIEEVRRKGVSRRINKSFDLRKLTRQSRIYFAHPKAYYYTNKEAVITPACLYTDETQRIVGDFAYYVKPQYVKDKEKELKKAEPGLFMWTPITHIDYVKPKDKRMLQRLEEVTINLKVCNE